MKIQELIRLCKTARRQWGIATDNRARYGDCSPVAIRLKRLIEERTDYTAAIKGGEFICDSEEEVAFDHTWVEVEGCILDPTVDMFFSDLSFDMVVKVEGIYFSHPDHDGNELKDCYVPK